MLNKNQQCHPCESRGPERKSWIPASVGMTSTFSATGTSYALLARVFFTNHGALPAFLAGKVASYNKKFDSFRTMLYN